jgi:superfamily II DNA or RNA helicase
MELKKYQSNVLDALEDYIAEIKKYDIEKAAGLAFMIRTDKQYNWIPEIGRNPFVCIKVPTGGGKTLVASHSVGLIFKDYLGERNDKGLAVWFVPSDAIRTQTLDNLKNRKHSYREVLDQRFNNAVKVFDLSEAKSISKSDLEENICIIVATLSSFRRRDKEWLKVYQDNGALMNHFEGLESKDFDFLDKDKEREIMFSLSNVIKLHNPLVIVDEGHNIQTELSFDMIKDLNPSFVLEFTATPKGKSNVLVNISAKELKEAKMIKMPIYLANKTPWQETIYEGITKLEELERATKKNKGEYIRPIMLLQAEQEKESNKKIYVDKIKKFLIEDAKIPEEQIAIKTSKRDELPKIEELLSKKSPIRYVITVNALREGWDCPFAYILVSVSNLGARLSVEQTIGRIMRLPYAREKSDPILNSAYIFAATRSFSQTSEAVISGLQENGYEDIVPIIGGVAVTINEYKRKINDKNIIVPFINIKDGLNFRKLNYLGDLIGDAPVLEGKNLDMIFQIVENAPIMKIDIGKEGELIKDAAGKLKLIYHYKDLTREDLLTWFRIKIQRGFISISEMNNYLEKIIDKLLKTYNLSKLSVYRYQIKEAMEIKIDDMINEFTEKAFKKLENSNLLSTTGDIVLFGDTINLIEICPNSFSKHLYDRAGKMNKEELDLAFRLDSLDNVFWWFRNPERAGFHIQGWLKNKFYPDFLAKTKKGNYIVIEYKGAQFEESKDTKYKNDIGKKWQELGTGKYYFELVDKKNQDMVIDKISKL